MERDFNTEYHGTVEQFNDLMMKKSWRAGGGRTSGYLMREGRDVAQLVCSLRYGCHWG